MNINKDTGELNFGMVQLRPYEEIESINAKVKIFSYHFELLVHHDIWKTFRLIAKDEVDYILGLQFTNDKLKLINIAPNFELAKLTKAEQKEMLIQTLNNFGGEKAYEWGKTEVYDDIKAGLVSIILTYF
jgi:hypothetical protein